MYCYRPVALYVSQPIKVGVLSICFIFEKISTFFKENIKWRNYIDDKPFTYATHYPLIWVDTVYFLFYTKHAYM